jgi:glycosyltransferase involved in cell wall biosynthesis
VSDGRPLVALIHNVQTPYRVHFHRRLARELREVRFASVFTHDQADQPWERADVEEIRPVHFGAGHHVAEQSRGRWWLFDWRKGGRIIQWLRRERAEAVVIGGYNDLTRLRLIRWCRRNRVSCFVFSDSNILGDRATGVRRLTKTALVRWVVRSCAGVMPCGSLGARYFAKYGARAENIFYVPYEPDYDLLARPDPAAVEEARRRCPLDPARRRLVVCARLIGVKRVDLALDAFASIAPVRPLWDLVIIGDGPLRESLRARVPAELRDRAIFTGFIGEPAVISALYRHSHVLVCPSDFEPWGVVINEAAAAGMAIVSTNVVGAAAELVSDGVNGYLVPPSDSAALADALERVTEPARLDALRAGSAGVLAGWRTRGDPVRGLRRALESFGVLPRGAHAGISPHRSGAVSV